MPHRKKFWVNYSIESDIRIRFNSRLETITRANWICEMAMKKRAVIENTHLDLFTNVQIDSLRFAG